MKIKKQITDNAVKTVRGRLQYQIDIGLWPYPCEKRDEGKGRESLRVRGLRGAKNRSRETRSRRSFYSAVRTSERILTRLRDHLEEVV